MSYKSSIHINWYELIQIQIFIVVHNTLIIFILQKHSKIKLYSNLSVLEWFYKVSRTYGNWVGEGFYC